jgi:hypothetical protein
MTALGTKWTFARSRREVWFQPKSGHVPTLALLNIRTGYWLRNPRHVAKARLSRLPTRNVWANYYFVLEMLGLLSERREVRLHH